MRSWGIVLSLVTAAALLPGGAQAEPVVVGSTGVVFMHAEGMPATAEPWRTLVQGSLISETRTNTWTMGAKLGGPVPAGKTVSISWSPGRQHPHGCEPLMTITEPAATVGADGTVQVERHAVPEYYPGTTSQETTCLSVSLYTDGATTDELVGSMGPYSFEAGAEARLGPRTRIAVGRTTPVLLAVSSHERDTSAVRITGSGPGVRMKTVTTGPVTAEQTIPVVTRLSAPGTADTELALVARDEVGSDSFDGSWAVVARKIKAQRPTPGRYASKDGTVRFRVSKDNRIVRLRTSAVVCPERPVTAATYPVEIKIPKTGATAAVAKLGERWLGAQLMTHKATVVRGGFFVSTPGCTSWQQFVARRQS